MDATRFDALTRGLAAPASRRVAGRFLAWLGLTGLLARTRAVHVAVAKGNEEGKQGKQGKKRKKPKVTRNQFGCVDVGDACANNAQCCSNICRGKKGKRTCRAHNTGGSVCEPVELGFCGAGDDVSAVICNNGIGRCVTTTGNAPYCAGSQPEESCSPDIVPCKKDKDCQRFCGADAACIQCPACAEVFGVSTACAGPAPDSCLF